MLQDMSTNFTVLSRLFYVLQDMSTHFTVLSHLAMAVDGYREVQGQARMSPKTMALAIWAIALCLVLPYRPYITYTDLAVRTSKYIMLL